MSQAATCQRAESRRWCSISVSLRQRARQRQKTCQKVMKDPKSTSRQRKNQGLTATSLRVIAAGGSDWLQKNKPS